MRKKRNNISAEKWKHGIMTLRRLNWATSLNTCAHEGTQGHI